MTPKQRAGEIVVKVCNSYTADTPKGMSNGELQDLIAEAIRAASLDALEEAAKIADVWAENCGYGSPVASGIAEEIRKSRLTTNK